MSTRARKKTPACVKSNGGYSTTPQQAKRFHGARISLYLPFLPPVRQYAYAHSSSIARR